MIILVYNWTDLETNTIVLNELKLSQIIYVYKTNWTNHDNKMPRNILPRILNIFLQKTEEM